MLPFVTFPLGKFILTHCNPTDRILRPVGFFIALQRNCRTTLAKLPQICANVVQKTLAKVCFILYHFIHVTNVTKILTAGAQGAYKKRLVKISLPSYT